MTRAECLVRELRERMDNICAFSGNNLELEKAEINTAKKIIADLDAEIKNSYLNVGDVVIHTKHPAMKRRVRKIENNKILLSGFYEFVNLSEVRKVNSEED